MTDFTSFLSTELTEIGLAAAADPAFADRLIEALRRLPTEKVAEPAAACESPNGASGGEVSEQ